MSIFQTEEKKIVTHEEQRSVAQATQLPLHEPSAGGLAGNGQAGFTLVSLIAAKTPRFRVHLSEKDIDAQKENRGKFLKLVAFTDFSPASEEAMEDWIDAAARQITKNRLTCDLFQDAWSAAAHDDLAGIIEEIPSMESYEELINLVAIQVFPTSAYLAHKIQGQIVVGKRASTTFQAKQWLSKIVARYYRICKRHGLTIAVTDDMLKQSALNSLPSPLVDALLQSWHTMTWDTLWTAAARLEQDLIQTRGHLPELGAYPVEDTPMTPYNPLLEGLFPSSPSTAKDLTARPCGSCGRPGHYRRNCSFRNHRCRKCQRIGHIEAACRNLVVKDAKGRVDTRVEPKPSGTTYVQRKDKSKTEQLVSMESVLSAIRSIAEKRAEKSADTRQKKKIEKGWQRKRKVIEHPVGAAEEIHSDGERSASESSDNLSADVLEELAEALSQLHAVDEEEEEVTPTVVMQATVNNVPLEVVIDSGASRSLCSAKTAEKLRLHTTNQVRRFKGMGRGEGRRSEDVDLRIGKAHLRMNFWVVDQADLPTLIGAQELRAMNVLIDPCMHRLLDLKTFKVIANKNTLRAESKNIKVEPVFIAANDKQHLSEKNNIELEDALSQVDDLKRRADVADVLNKYSDVWTTLIPGAATSSCAAFEVKGIPVKSKLRRLTPELQKELDRHLDSMLEKNVIRPSKSAWLSAPVFVRKKNGAWRLCLDYRRMNAQMTPDRYPLPLLWEQVTKAAHHRLYTCLDLSNGFWNLPLAEDSKKYTAFVTHRGSFEFNVLPFGVRNSPSEFQRLMDLALNDLYPLGILCYVDDIVIFDNDYEEHLKKFELVMERLGDKGLYVQLSKCSFLQEQVKFLGHIISFDGIQPDKDKVEAIWQSRPPRDKKELRSFLGMASYLRKFVPHFSSNVAPMTSLLKKNAKYDWTEKCNEAYEWTRTAISDQVLLSAPTGEGPFVIATDASDLGVGAVLMQLQENEIAILEFASRSLSDTQRRWPTYEREAYAIRWAVEKFEDYIRTGPVIVLTDHQALKWMGQATSGKVQRWSLYLQQFDITVHHIPGNTNVVADWLSRSAEDGDDFNDENVVAIPAFPVEDVPIRQRKTWRQSFGLAPYVPTSADLITGYESMSEADIKSTYLSTDDLRYSIRTNRLYIPPNCREIFMYWFHCARYGGHCGINRTIRRMARWIWWPTMSADTRAFIKQCLTCLRHALPPKKPTVSGVLARPLPFQLVSMDLVGPRKWSTSEWYYLCIIDHFSRYMVARAIDVPPTATWICSIFTEAWMSIFQAPTAILSDRGPQFRADAYREFVTQEVLALLVYSSPYYPRGNAVNEASHKSLEVSLIASAEHPDATDFVTELRNACMVYNSVPHVHTGQSPNYMLFGMELTLPGWQKYRPDTDTEAHRINALRQSKLHSIAQAQVTEERIQSASPKEKVEVGDWITYYLSDYEKGVLSTDPISTKYKANWSLPALVKALKDKAIVVLPWGAGTTERQVPLAQVKKLTGTVPAPLAEENILLLEKYQPRVLRHWALKKNAPPLAAPEWSAIIEKTAAAAQETTSTPEDKAQDFKKRKLAPPLPYAIP